MTAGLLDRQIAFCEALRRAGIPVALSEVLDATRAMGTIDLLDRESLRAALAACVLHRPAQRAAYDVLFDLWWPPVVGDPVSFDDHGVDEGEGGPDGPPVAIDPDDPEAADRARELLLELLLNGDDEALRRFARLAVSTFGRAQTQPGKESWFSYRVLRRLSPETLMAQLLDAVLRAQGQERGGFAERIARQTLGERMQAFRDMVEQEVRRRLAEAKGPEQLSKTAVPTLAEQVDFLRASRADMQELRRQVFPLARRLGTRLTARQRLGRTGRLDARRTIRASMATGGVPIVTHHRPHKPHKPELTVLCDVSGSVAGFAHFTLMLSYALSEQFTKVRAFAFVDTTDEVTRFFTPGGDLAEAVARMGAEAQLVWFDGHSDYGHSIEVFAERYPDAVGPKTSLLVLGDARNNYRATGAQTLKGLVQRARHAYWLNPEPQQSWGTGDSAAKEYAELLEMVEVRNAVQLEEFVTRLLPV